MALRQMTDLNHAPFLKMSWRAQTSLILLLPIALVEAHANGGSGWAEYLSTTSSSLTLLGGLLLALAGPLAGRTRSHLFAPLFKHGRQRLPGHLRPAEGLGEKDIGDTEFIGHQPALAIEAALKCLESTLEFPLGCLLDGITALVLRQREGVLGQCPQRLLKLGGQETEPLIHLCLPGQRLWQQAPFSRERQSVIDSEVRGSRARSPPRTLF